MSGHPKPVILTSYRYVAAVRGHNERAEEALIDEEATGAAIEVWEQAFD